MLFKLPFLRDLDVHMKEVVQGAGVAFLLKLVGASFSFGFSVLLARLFGADGAGVYFLALTVSTIGATFGRFGLENTLLRFVSAHAAKGEWPAVRGVFKKGMGLALAISSLISFLLFFLAPLMAVHFFHKPTLAMPLRWMALTIAPFSMLFLYGELLKGLKYIRDSQLVQGVALPVLTFVGLFCLGDRFGVEGAIWIYLVSTIAVSIWGAYLWRSYTPQLRCVVSKFETSQLLVSCVPLFWVQVMSMLINWSAILCLGIWASKADVGIFGAALRTAMLTSFILTSVNSIAAPKFSELYSQGDLQGLSTTAKKSAAMMTAIATPILLVFIVVPEDVMRMFGDDFKKGGVLLAILAVGQFINVATGSVGYLLMMSGNERLMRDNTIVVGVVTVILSIILIPTFGAIGAAISTAISMAMLNLGALLLVWKKMGILTVGFKIR